MKLLKVCSFLFSFFITAACLQAMPQTQVFNATNFLDCVRVEVLGLGVTTVGGKPTLGLKIRHWRPELVCETVIKPGDTVLLNFGDFLQKAIKAGSWGGVSSGPQRSGFPSSSNLQFSEVHIYSYPFGDIANDLFKLWCRPDVTDVGEMIPKNPFVIKYLSELDSIEWRIGIAEAFHPKSILSYGVGPFCGLSGPLPGKWKNFGGLCMGTWGPLYPRRGFLVHQSKVVGSAANVFRAVSISNMNPVNYMHVVPARLNFNASTNDMLQLAFPRVSGCIKIGQTPATWDYGMVSPNGKYLWIYWRQVECVIPFHP